MPFPVAIEQSTLDDIHRMAPALDAVRVGLCARDASGRFCVANRTAHRLHAVEALIGRAPSDLGPDAAAVHAIDAEVLATGRTIERIERLGPTRVIAARFPWWEDGRVGGTVCVWRAAPELASRDLKPVWHEITAAARHQSAPDAAVFEDARDRGLALAIFDDQMRFRRVTPALAELLGADEAALVGRYYPDCVVEPEQQRHQRSFRRLVERELDHGIGERTFERADGTLVRMHGIGGQLVDGHGRAHGVCVLFAPCEDTIATGLRTSATRFATALEITPIGMAVFDAEIRFKQVNRAFAALLGGEPEDFVGRSYFDLVAPEDLPAARRSAQRLLAEPSHQATTERHTLCWDGRRVLVRATGSVLRDGNGQIEGFLGVYEDIGERLATEQALHETNERFRVAFDQAPYGIAILTLDGRFAHVNTAFAAMIGTRPEEIVGTTMLELTHPDDREASEARRSGLVVGRTLPPTFEKRYLRRDGSIVEARATNSVLRDSSGQPAFLMAVVQDLSGEKVQQAERQRLEEQLRRSQRLETVGRLAGGIAHEFNNMLAVILNGAHFASRREPGDLRQKQDLEHIQNAANRCAMLTRQLMIYGRRDQADPELLDLNDLAERTASLVHRTYGEGVELVLDLERVPWRVELPRTHAEQLLTHLTVNGYEAMREGGRMRIVTRNEADGDASWVRVTIEDTGVGMPPDVASLAFEPFFTTKEIGEGPGLGLTLVQGIVSHVGGRIDIHSEPGRGTRVDVLLPAVRAAAADAEPLFGPSGAGEALLVIDDEPAILELMCRLLSDAGYAPVPAASAADAVRACAERPFDLIVADVIMPEASGPKLVGALRALRPDTRVLFVSGYAEERLTYSSLEPDSWFFLPKPFEPEDLLRAVRRALAAKPS